jgi:selenoprotein W-related protein
LAEQLKKQKNVEIEFIKSSGGVFEVFKEEQKIYSKKSTGRFPNAEEILKQL